MLRREEEIRSLDEDVALALASGKDDLARFAIRRLLPKRAEVKALAARIAERAKWKVIVMSVQRRVREKGR